MANIADLGYAYDRVIDHNPRKAVQAHIVRVSGINRGLIGGSFVVTVNGTINDGAGSKTLVGYEPVFSRWHVAGCANCSNSLSVPMHIPLVYYPQGISKPGQHTPPLKYITPLPRKQVHKMQYTASISSNSASMKEKEHVVRGAFCELGTTTYLV